MRMGNGANWVRAALAALLLVVIGQAYAADETPEEFLNGLATLDSRYLPAGSVGTGEAIDLYTGSFGLVVTDVSLPGNSDLRVALTRRFRPAFPGKDDGRQAFGDWSFEQPVITGIVSNEPGQDGWRANDELRPYARCSEYNQLPIIQTEWGEFKPDEYNRGFRIEIPGEGVKTLLRRGPDNPHSPQMTLNGQPLTFPLVTKDDWMAACIPLVSGTGEGFLLVAPDGRKFWFDTLRYTSVSRISKPSDSFPRTDDSATPQASSVAWMERERALLYASRVEDRFGHWVTWSSNRIQADDGRRIDLHYDGGQVDTVTAQPQSGQPRVWSYSYDTTTRPSDSQTVATLSHVFLPDTSHWDYDLEAISYASNPSTTFGCGYPSDPAPRPTLSGSITTPAGMQVAYEVARVVRGHSATPYSCRYTSTTGDLVSKHPVAFTVFAMQGKTATGAGLPSRTWTYEYAPFVASWSSECDPNCPGGDTVWTKITDPEGRVAKYTWSNRFDETESQLKSIEYRNSASGPVVRREDHVYADADTGPWPESYGAATSYRSNAQRRSTRTPLQTRTISDGGVDYTWHAGAWNNYAEPTDVTRSSSGSDGDSVSETLAWDNNTSVWVLGQLKSRTVTAPAADAGAVPESRTYHASDATLGTVIRFGRPVATYSWYPTGTPAGNLHTVTDGNNHTTTYSDYLYGIPQTIAYADNTSIGLTPNDFGEVQSVTDERNHTTTVQRDDLGRVTHKTFPGGDPTSLEPINIQYQRITSTEYGVAGTHWRVTRTQGRRKQVTVYDAALEPVLDYSIDSTDNEGHMAWHQYDAAGRTTFASYPLDYAANLPGSVVGVETYYDVLGRVTKTRADSELGVLTTRIGYLTGNKRTVTDPRNHATTTTYQAFDQPSYAKAVKVSFADGTSTTVVRDSFGAPTSMTQSGTWTPPGQSTAESISVSHSFGYDDDHRLCRQVSPETGTTGFGYDAAGNLKWTAQGLSADPCVYAPSSSTKIIRYYDQRNRLTDIDYPSATSDKHFTYYDDGKLATAIRSGTSTSAASTWTMHYLHRGQIKDETLSIDGHGFLLAYQYDAEGDRKRMTDPAPVPRTPR